MTRNLLIKIFQVPPPIDEFVEFTPSLQNYKPIFYINNYWNLNKVNLDSWISIIRKELGRHNRSSKFYEILYHF